MKKLSFIALVIVLGGVIQAATITALPASATTANTLVNSIVGSGITVVPGSVSLVGSDNQQGTFVNGAASVGLASGIVLTSGSAANLNGANSSTPETLGSGGSGTNSWTTPLSEPGDSVLSTIAGQDTFDANLLSFSFQFGDGSIGGDLYFSFVFASEEYLDYVDSDYNDVFAFLVDDANIALVNGQPITINNINPNSNAASYINNVPNTNGYPNANRAIQADGLTTVLTARKLGLGPGTHRMSFRIADSADQILDAAVFIGGGSFSDVDPEEPEPPEVPEPGTWTMLVSGLALLATRQWATSRRNRQ